MDFGSTFSANVGMLRDAGEESNIRTFTKWINSKLIGTHPRVVVNNLIEDLRDGRVLISLLEVLLKIKLRREKGKSKLHKINNVDIVLKTLEFEGLKLHGISREAIVDGIKISILGLVWIIILHFQVQGVVFEAPRRDPGSQKPRKKSTSQVEVEHHLLEWIQELLKGFSDVVTVVDIRKSWRDGFAFLILLYVFRPDVVDIEKAQKMTVRERLDYAFNVAEDEFNVHRLLEPSDVDQDSVDKKAMLMYLSSLYEVLRSLTPAVTVRTSSHEVKDEETIVSTTTTTVVESTPGATLRFGDEVVYVTTVSKNETVLEYKIIYHEIIFIIKFVEAKMAKIQAEEPSQENTMVLEDIKKQMTEVQSNLNKLNELNKQMVGVEGVDRHEFNEIQSERAQFSKRWSKLIQETKDEDKRQPAIQERTEYRTTVVKSAPTATVHYGDEDEIVITTVSTNLIVIEYLILYYEIIWRLKTIEKNMAQIKAASPSSTTVVMVKDNELQMNELQIKIKELQEMSKNMAGADGVDPKEFSEIQYTLRELNSRWTITTVESEAEERRITSSMDSSIKQKKALDDWRGECESIGEWMDSIEDRVEMMENRKPSGDLMTLKRQMEDCDKLQEMIASDETPRSTFSLGDEITSEPNLNPDQKFKIGRQMSQMKTEVKTLSERAGAARQRYKRAIDLVEEDKKRQLLKLQTTFSDLHRRISNLKVKGDMIGQVEGDQTTVRRKETELELLVSDIQVFQPHFDDYRQAIWEIMEDPSVSQSEKEQLQAKLTSLEEQWGALIRSVYSRGETAKNLISKLPQGGVLEELIILENVRHQYSIDWGSHVDLFGTPDQEEEDALEVRIHRDRLMARWKRECRELEDVLSEVERENNELEDIADDPSKIAMQKAKLKVILMSMDSVDKEYNDLPRFAKFLFEDPKIPQEDRDKIQSDLNSYTTRHQALRELVLANDDRIQKYLPSQTNVTVTEKYVFTEKKEEPPVTWIRAVVEESAPPEPELPSNAEAVNEWWDEHKEVTRWTSGAEKLVQQDVRPSWRIQRTTERHDKIEKLIQDISAYDTKVIFLLKKGNDIVNDAVTVPEDRQRIEEEIKSIKERWDRLQVDGFNVERSLHEQINKLREHEEWTRKSAALKDWLDDTEHSLDSCATLTSDPKEKEKQSLFLQKFLSERKPNQESVDEVLGYGNRLVEKHLVPDENHPEITKDVNTHREKWNKLVSKAEILQKSVELGEKDVKKFTENRQEYEIIITWIIQIERRIQELRGDQSGDDEALRKRRIIIEEIIMEITVYRIRLRELIGKNKELLGKDSIPPEERDKLLEETKALEIRLDKINNEGKEQGKRLDDHIQGNTTKYEDWQTKADDLDKWLVSIRTELKAVEVPTSDHGEREKQKEYLDDFETQKQDGAHRVNDVVRSGRQLIEEGIIPDEKRGKVEIDLESFPGTWDSLVETAEVSRKTLDKASRSADDYEVWIKESEDVNKNINKTQEELESCAEPTSDLKERKRRIVIINKITSEKPKSEDLVDKVVSLGKRLENDEHLLPEQRERVAHETKEIEENWKGVSDRLDDIKTSSETGMEDTVKLYEWRNHYEVITIWTTKMKKAFVPHDHEEPAQDLESLKERRRQVQDDLKEVSSYEVSIVPLLVKGKHVSESGNVAPGDRQQTRDDLEAFDKDLEEIKKSGKEEDERLDNQIKNVERYEVWQKKADDLDKWFGETKKTIESCDVPNSDVKEREEQKKFLNDFHKRKPAQEKKVNDVVISGRQLVDENIVPADKREKVELDLQNVPDTWNDLVEKADESRKTSELSLQDVILLNKWREEYKVVLLWVEKAEEKQKQHEDVGDDIEKLKKERKKLEGDIKEITKYEAKITPLLSRGDVVSQSKLIDGDDAESVEHNTKSLKERFEKLKSEETDRKQNLDERIQWLTEYKGYRTEADSLNVMLDDSQKKLESCEKPTSSKSERDKQSAFLNKFVKEKPQNDKRVETTVHLGNRLADEHSVPEDKREEVKEETKRTEDDWRILVAKVEELQKIVNSGIQNITELSDWRKEYSIVIKWIETAEKKLIGQGEPGTDYKDLLAKCSDLEEMVNVLSTYETRVTILLGKGEQLSKEASIEENDRTQTETDTKSLRERWDELKKDEEEQKKRYDEQKKNVEDYRDWHDDLADVKPWLENTKSNLDACKRSTSDHVVRDKQAEFIKGFIDDKEKNQGRVDSVIEGGHHLLEENQENNRVVQQEAEKIREEVENCEKSWKTILLEFDDVENSVTTGQQDIAQLQEWRENCRDLTKALDNAKENVRGLGKSGGDSQKIEKQKEQFEFISKEMNSSGKQIDDLSKKADYLIISNIDSKDKEKLRYDMDNLNNSSKNYKNEEATTRASMDDNISKLHKFNDWQVEITDTNKWLGDLQETIETAEKPSEDHHDKQKQTESLKLFLESKEENQKRVDSVVHTGEGLVKDNQVPKDKQGQVKRDVKDVKDSWDSTLRRGEKLHTLYISYPVQPEITVVELIETQNAPDEVENEPPATVDYREWKADVEELERVLDEHDSKFDPKSDIEKEYSNLEGLAKETKESGKELDGFCKRKLAEIRTGGEALIESQQLSPGEEDEVKEKMSSLNDKSSRVNSAVAVVRMKVRDAALDYFNDTLNQRSVNVAKMHETVKSLRPPANDLPGVLVQHASLKTLKRRIEEEEMKLNDAKEKVNTMADAEVLPRDGFAGTLNDRCEEVEKEQQTVKEATEEAKPKLFRALLTQYNRTRKDVAKWLKQCEAKERNVNVDNLKDSDQTYAQSIKLKEAKVLFEKGDPKYKILSEVHKEAVEDEILTGKKAIAAEQQLESLTTRHDELQKRLSEKEQTLHSTLSKSVDDILNSTEEKVKEGESWVEHEDPAVNFSKAKEQQDLMKERELVLNGRQVLLLNELTRLDKMAASDVLPEKKRSASLRRIQDIKQRHTSAIQAAKAKTQNIQVNYLVLLRPEMEKRKAWLLDHEDSVGPIVTNFKGLNEFKEIYDKQKEFKKELDENSIEVLLVEADNIEGVEPDVKDELKDLDQRWHSLNNASEENLSTYENIMNDWEEFREHQLAILNWVDEKDREVSAHKNQVNYADEDEVIEQIQQLKAVKEEAEEQEGPQQTKLNETGEKLIGHLGKDSPAAAEITKQMEEVESCRKDFVSGIEQRLEKIEVGKGKTKELYSAMDDVTTWLDSTDNLIDTYDDKKPQGDDEGKTDVDDDVAKDDVDAPHESEVKEEKVHVVEELLANRKLVAEKQATLDKVVKYVEDLDGELDESAAKIAENQVNELTHRWNIVTEKMDSFFAREIPEMEIAEIKAEHLDEDSVDETDLNSVISMDEWRSKVRKVNLLLKYLERLVRGNADVKRDYPIIRILASNTKEATKTIKLYCKPRMQVVTVLGQNIVNRYPENIDDINKITETTKSLTKRIEDVEHNADLLKMKVRDLTLDYFNERLNDCEIKLEQEEENVSKLTTEKTDLESTREQMVLLKEGRKEYDHNQNNFQEVVHELSDKRISEFLSKEGFQGTLLEKSEDISNRRNIVDKKLTGSKSRIHRDLVSYMNEKKRVVSKWLSACEKKEKTIKVEPAASIVPVDEYAKLKLLEKDLDDGESKYQETAELNEYLITEKVLDGRKATSSEKEAQNFKDRYVALRKRVDDKKKILYFFLFDSANSSMDEVQSNLTKAEESVNERTLSDRYPQAKQDFHTAQTVKEDVGKVTVDSTSSLKDVHQLLALDIFTDEDAKRIRDRRSDLKERNAKLSETADEKFGNFAKQYNQIIEDEVKHRKMWLDKNESLMEIVDNDVDDLPGFEKKLEEQKTFDEKHESHKMIDLVDEAKHNLELNQDIKGQIYEMDERWHTIDDWSNERENKLTKVTSDWRSLQEEQKAVVEKLDSKEGRLKEIVAPVDFSNFDDTNEQRKEFKNLQVDVQELGLPVIRISKSAKALIKLIGVDTPAAKHIEKQVEDLENHRNTINNDTLTRIKKLDSSERKTKSLNDHMDTVKSSMEVNTDLLNDLNKEIDKQEKERDEEMNLDEGIEIEDRDNDENTEEEQKRSLTLNNFVDQISLRLGDRAGEKARVERVKELKDDLEEDLGEEAKNALNTEVEEFGSRWEELSREMEKTVEKNESPVIESMPVKASEVEDLHAAILPVDLDGPTDYGSWKESTKDIDDSMKGSQAALKIYNVDVVDYPSLEKAEVETQDIIIKINAEYKPQIMILRTSGERISDKDDDVTGEDITKAVDASQKNLEGLQGALEHRKYRLRDSAIQHMNERIRDCEAQIGEERVNLKLLSPTGKDLETVLDQLSFLEESKKTFSTNQNQFEEVQVHLNEIKKSKILASPEFENEFQDDCKDIALQRALVLKQIQDNKNRIHRSIINFFDTKRKNVSKWLKNCEKKEREVNGDAQDLDSALGALEKLKDAENTVKQGEANYHETVELLKTVSEHELLQGKKATDAEHEITTASQRYNQTLEDIQNKKNKLYKTIYQLLSNDLDGTEKEIQKTEGIVQLESHPEDPTSTHEELSELKVLVSSSGKLREDSSKIFDKANMVLSSDVLPKEDKKEIRTRVVDLQKRAYDLPGATRTKYDQVYRVYVGHLTTIIRLREEWIIANEPRLKEPESTAAADISELEKEINEHEGFEKELNKNNVRSVIEQIQDTEEIDPEVPLSELLGFEKRWEVLDSWLENRKQLLKTTLENWQTFRDEEETFRAFIDKENNELNELDVPVNLADKKAVETKLEALKNLRLELVEYSPNLLRFDKSGEELLQNLNPDSNGTAQVKEQIANVETSWKKLELDAERSIEKMEKSGRTIKAIYSYMEVVNNWLDETDTRLVELHTSKDKITSAHEEDDVDGGERPGEDEASDKEKTSDESKQLSEEEKEQLLVEIRAIRETLKTNLGDRDLNKARTDRVHVLVKDVHDNVDANSERFLQNEIQMIEERWQQVEKKLDNIGQDEYPKGSEEIPSDGEPVIQSHVAPTLESHAPESVPAEQPLPSPETEESGDPEKISSEEERLPIEPYAGKVTLDLKEWRAVATNLRNFFIRMQMNVRDIDSSNYLEMRECELDTKECIDAMRRYGRPCLNDILVSGRGMLSSPEYSPEDKNEISTGMEILTVSAHFVHNHAEDQRQRLYRALVVYQNDQRKVIQRWLNSCTRKGKEVHEDAAGLEGSNTEYKKVQELKRSLAEEEPTFLNFKELSKRMIDNHILDGKKASETEKDIASFTTTYDDLRTLADRKEKRLYTTVLKSICLPLESIEQSVKEAETWVEPRDLSDDYVEAKEQLNKMKLSAFVVETLNTRSRKVLAETETVVASHDVLSPDDKEKIQERIKVLSPRTEVLPAAAFNKYKRMYREYLVLFEHEVQLREQWFEKNESKLTSSPVGDAKDLSDILRQKDKHDEFVSELEHYDMSECVKDMANLREIKKDTREKIRDLQNRWLVLSTWADDRTTFLTSVIAKWQVFREQEIAVLDFIDAKEREIQELERANLSDNNDSTEQVDKLEKIQNETQDNSLEVWNVQRQCAVLVKDLGEDSEAGKHVLNQAADLKNNNEDLSKEILVRINKLDSARHKTNKLHEHVKIIEKWITPTEKLIGNFNAVVSKLPTSEVTPSEVDGDAESEHDSSPGEVKVQDEQELQRIRNQANEIVHDIAVKRTETPVYHARVERVQQLQTELQDDLDESSKATLDEKVEDLTGNWENVNSGVDKVAWQKIPGIVSLQAKTYEIQDLKVSQTEEISPVASFDEWKEKVSELEQCLAEAETKEDPNKSIEKDYTEIQTLLTDVQDRQTSINENYLPKLHQIRINAVQLYKEEEDKQSSEHLPNSADQKDGSNALKSEISTAVLSLHERIQTLQSSIELQKLRLGDVVVEYLRERIRNDQMNLSHEQVEKKKLFPEDDAEAIKVHLDIMKEREQEFTANDKTFYETQEQFNKLNENPFLDDKRFDNFMTDNIKNISIQRKTLWKLLVDIKHKLHRNILNKYNDGKSTVTKWLKNIEKRERNVDPNVNGIEKVFTECGKLKSVKDDIGEGEANFERLMKLSEDIQSESIWDERRTDESKAELDALGERLKKLSGNIEDKQNTLHAKVKGNLEETLDATEVSISEAEPWVEASTLSDDLEQAKVEIRKSMEHVTGVNNKYTKIMQALKRPQQMAQSDALPDEITSRIDSRCKDLSKRMGRLPSAVFKKHKSLYETFTDLLRKVVSEREKWISENESQLEVIFINVASLEDLKNKVDENEMFVEQVANYNMEPIIVELEKMGDPDFELKATTKDLQSRWLAVDAWAKERKVLLHSMLEQWESVREQLKTLIDWIDLKDAKLREMNEQIDLADDVEVKDELTNLKAMQTEIEDTSSEVTKLKRASDELIRIMGDDSDAHGLLEGQISEFDTCWTNFKDEIQERVRQIESSERQLSTLYRYMDQTNDWIEDMEGIVDQYQSNERWLQDLHPVESETEPTEQVQTENAPDDIEGKTKDGEEDVEQEKEEGEETGGLDEDKKEELSRDNKKLVEVFVIKRRKLAKYQAFVDWTIELEKHVTKDLDDNSKKLLSIKIEKFGSQWDVFIEKLDTFSEKQAQEIQVVERRLAEYQSEPIPESVSFQEWKTETEELEEWFESTKGKCDQQTISKDTDGLKEREKAAKILVVELTGNGQPHLNRVIVLGNRLLDAKTQTPEEESEIVKKITTLTKTMIEVERLIELQRIRTLETIVDYCKERLHHCETKVIHDESGMNQLTPSASTPETVHEQIVLLKVCEKEVPENDKEFREINTYMNGLHVSNLVSYETRDELERNCNALQNRRTVVYKLLRESRVRLYRTMSAFFYQHKKIVVKWLTSCEKKEKQVKPDAAVLRESRDEYFKVKDARKEFDEGHQNYFAFVELHKTVVADDVMLEKKAVEAEQDVNSITGRVERIDKMLHEHETKLYNTLFLTLTQLLDSIENTLSEARDRIKPNEIISTYFKTAKKQMEETQAMARYVGTVHTETSKSIDEADDVKKAKLLGPEDADTIELRINDLSKKCADIRASAVEEEIRMRAEYVTTFKTELERCSQWITFLEMRVEKIDGEAEDLNGYQQLQEDHLHFEEDLKVYDLTMLLDEVDKIEELDDTVKRELMDLEKRWKKLLKWSEERKLRLLKLVTLWSKFREEEIAIVSWVEEKKGKLKEQENQVDLSNQDDISRQLDILKVLRRETEIYAAQVTDAEAMGNELKRIVGDQSNAGVRITKQLSEVDNDYNEILKEILQRIETMESAQRRLKSLLDDMEVVTAWMSETELLLDEFDEKEKKLVDLEKKSSGEPSEQDDEELKKETKKERKERLKEEKLLAREEMIALIEDISVKFDKLPVNQTKVDRVNELGSELKEVNEAENTDLDNQLQQFNERWNSVSERLKDLVNKDLPESTDCFFVRLFRRKFLRASINN